MSVTEILEEVSKLSPQEKEQIINALLHDQEVGQSASIEERRAELHRQLLAEGLIKNIPPRRGRPPELRDFKPLTVEGKPVSETIIEERR